MVEALTEREMEVLRALASGKSNKEIAEALFLSVYTVQVHLRNIFAKLGVSSRTEAVTYAIRQGWVKLEGQP
jgi:NarL family two-component system response regulator LiaR